MATFKFDPQYLQSLKERQRYGDKFPLYTAINQSKNLLRDGKSIQSDQNLSFLHHFAPIMKTITATVPTEEIIDVALLDSHRPDKKGVNFEKMQSLAYDLYKNLAEYEVFLDPEFEQDLTSGLNHDEAVKNLYQRHGLTASAKTSANSEDKKFKMFPNATNHDTPLHGDFTKANFALESEPLYHLLETHDHFKNYAHNQFTSPLAALEEKGKMLDKESHPYYEDHVSTLAQWGDKHLKKNQSSGYIHRQPDAYHR